MFSVHREPKESLANQDHQDQTERRFVNYKFKWALSLKPSKGRCFNPVTKVMTLNYMYAKLKRKNLRLLKTNVFLSSLRHCRNQCY